MMSRVHKTILVLFTSFALPVRAEIPEKADPPPKTKKEKKEARETKENDGKEKEKEGKEPKELKEPKDTKEPKETSREAKEAKAAEEIHPYKIELSASLDLDLSTGVLNKTGETPEKFSETKLMTETTFGYLVSPTFEPIVEIDYTQSGITIGDFEKTTSTLKWSAGALFNMPIANGVTDVALAFTSAKWIPYGGFLLSGQSLKETTASTASPTSLGSSLLNSKLVFGTRYFLYPHIALNFWVRLSYTSSSSEVSSEAASGGAFNKLNAMVRLMSFSFLF